MLDRLWLSEKFRHSTGNYEQAFEQGGISVVPFPLYDKLASGFAASSE